MVKYWRTLDHIVRTHLCLIMCTTKIAHRKKSMKLLQGLLLIQHCRAIMQQYLHTGKLELEKPSPCKLLSLYSTVKPYSHFKIFGSCREGFNREGGLEARGIIPRAIEQIFGHIQKFASPKMRFLVRASYLQIYNETVRARPAVNHFVSKSNKCIIFY